MKLSLSGRIALGLVGQVVVLASATAYLVWVGDGLFDDFAVLKEDLDPAIDDLKSLSSEMKAIEEMLSSGRTRDLDHVGDMLARARLFERLASNSNALKRVAAWEGATGEVAAALADASDQLAELASGDRLITGSARTMSAGESPPPGTNEEFYRGMLARLEASAAAGRTSEADAVARELVRTTRILRAVVLRAGYRAIGAARDATQHLIERRSAVSLAVVLVPAGALVVALVVMFMSLRALVPLRTLTEAVRGLARGDYTTPARAGLSSELADLSDALASLAEALRTREATIERKKGELMKAERLAVVGRMASVVAHEVRNPLNSISMNVDLLREMLDESRGTDDRARALVAAIQAEVDRLSEITEEYLRFGRMPKGTAVPCDLEAVVRSTLAFIEGEFTRAGVDVTLDSPPGPLVVLADESQLRQALLNILHNAVEAMPGGGKATVSIHPSREWTVVEVRDTGCGIPEDFRQRLFEPFATTKARGTGLGLAFVQQVVHESGGEVTLDSIPGRGTAVRMRLKGMSREEAP